MTGVYLYSFIQNSFTVLGILCALPFPLPPFLFLVALVFIISLVYLFQSATEGIIKHIF